MLSNGNYAQYFPQSLASPFMGFGTPQFGPQGQFSPQGIFGGQGQGSPGGLPGTYGANPYSVNPYGLNPGLGFGQEFGYPAFGQQGLGQQGLLPQSPFGSPFSGFGSNPIQSSGSNLALLLGQLANQVIAQGVAAQQAGASLGQLAQQIVTQSHYGNQTFYTQGRPGQAGNGFGGYGGFAPQTPQTQTWGFNRAGTA